MNIKDLKTGDVLLFSPEKGSFISWAITFLTDANVSHAAMFYNKEDNTIIEETPPQVAVNEATERFTGRKIHVRRLKEITDLDKVISASTTFLNEKEPYDNTGLYFVGALLIYKKFTPDTIKQRIIVKILQKVTASIVNYINKHKHPGELPMVCSQFVAQCYEDAGAQYKLQITNARMRIMNSQNESVSLLDQAITSQSNLDKESSWSELLKSNVRLNEIQETDEELCEELKDAFTMTNIVEDSSTTLSQELIDAVSDFGHAHHLLNANNELRTNKQTTSFGILKDMENMFVTPGDLLNHCSNLQDIGEIEG